MVGVNRTYNCKKCGGVLFRLNKLNGGMQIICENCSKTKDVVEFDKYTSFFSNCKTCGDNLVKVSVKVLNNFEEHMIPKCSKCKNEIEKVKIDDNRNIIDLETYKTLIDKYEREILKDKLEELEYSKENLEKENYRLEEENYNLENEVERLKRKLNCKIDTISELKKEIEGFKCNIEDKDRIISSLTDELESKQFKVEDLEFELKNLRYR